MIALSCTPKLDWISRRLFQGSWMNTASLTENLMLSLALSLMILLPLLEMVLRRLFATGIEASTTLVQHLTLIVGMLGAAVAARENRLLALSTLALLKNSRALTMLRLASSAVSVAVCGFLALSSLDFALAERLGGRILAYGIPLWVMQLILPGGFALIALRLITHASPRPVERWLVAGLAAAIGAFCAMAPIAPTDAVVPGLIALLAATLLGAPIFVTLGGTALILIWGQGNPIASVALDHYRLAVNPSLPAIPLFTVAGYLLAESGAPKRLVRVFNALFGRLRGGAVVATVLVCAFFTSFTGASGVTILALGGLLMPLLSSGGHSRRSALGLVTGAGLPGVLLLPALPLILYGVVANVDIKHMFLGALLPAVVMMSITGAWGIRHSHRQDRESTPFDWSEARQAVTATKWELLLPLVPIGALFGGLATPVEAAALTAGYAFIVETVIHRDLKPGSDVPKVLVEAGLLVGGILLILGVALGFTNFLVDARIPDQALAWVTQSIASRWAFLLALNLFLLGVGCAMDIYSAIVVLAPLLVPMGLAFGIAPIHLGVIFLANLELGFLTPPVGMNLFFASYRFETPLSEVYRSVIPLFLMLCVGVLIITYVPWLSTLLPHVLG